MNDKLKEKIIELETQNMAPILKESGIDFDLEVLKKALEEDQEIITIFEGETLLALLRYTINKNKVAWIRSIQIKEQSGNQLILFKLLKKALKNIPKEIEIISSAVQKANHKSLRLHKKLGFQIIKESPKATIFECEKEELLKKFKI